MGLGFYSAAISGIINAIQAADPADVSDGVGVMVNILSINPSLPTSFDIQLDRTGDFNISVTDTLFIGTHSPSFENVTSQPPLPVVNALHWDIPMDGMNVNGQAVSFNQSCVSGLNPGQISVSLDTGFTLPPLPKAAVDAIYGSIPGAMPRYQRRMCRLQDVQAFNLG